MMKQNSDAPYFTTKRALFGMHFIGEPFVALFSMLAVILTKELNATSAQIGLFTMLRPTVSLLSFYWGSHLAHTESCLKRNLMAATALSVIAFIFSPLSESVWYFIFAGALYSLFTRATIPAIMEILKRNVGSDREKLYTQVSVFAYGVGAIAALIYGQVLDTYPDSWQWLYSISAVLFLLSLHLQNQIVFDESQKPKAPEPLKNRLLDPWKRGLELLQRNKDFRNFQLGFLIAGFGLMFAIPSIPLYVTHLKLSFTQLFVSMTILKGFGFICTSHVWSKRLNANSILYLSMFVFATFFIFLITLLFGLISIEAIFLAYFIYGIAQAGSHLIWNLSGTLFSGNDSSSLYSSVNVLFVGLRGMIAPPLGGLISDYFGPPCAITIGALLCLAGALYIYLSLAQRGTYART